jgi:hypothetical protein
VRRWTWEGYVTGFLTFWAVAANNITFATNDYFWIVTQAIVCAGISTVILAFRWRRTGLAGRIVAAILSALNVWTLLDAGGRRLPAILGW